MGTDRDWEKWGRDDPYFGVLSAEKYRAENIDDNTRRAFFESGEAHVEDVLATIHSRVDPDFRPTSVVDLGCGVGRLVIPLARISDKVCGVDVSDSMLDEAARNCRSMGIENCTFVKSDDGLTQLEGSFDLIHSCLVLQHIPTARGMRLLEGLVRRLAPGGVVAIQFYYRCDAPKLIRSLVKLRYRFAPANALRNVMRGRPMSEPAMQLHTYALDDVVGLLVNSGVEHAYMQYDSYAEFQTVTLYAQRSPSTTN